MKRNLPNKKYSVEELVAAAYRAAGEMTKNRMLAAILVSKALESWLLSSGRVDLVQQLEGKTI
jgi:hypothetical protein